jgi:hypothetical protein
LFNTNSKFSKISILNSILFLLIFVFAFSLFRHISYPLLWNDESYGAMSASRVLQYGYPKIHDERGNPVFEPHKTFTPEKFYNETWDISTGMAWGNEYFLTPGVFLSGFTDDIYQKTALVRLPFAIAGFLGLLILMHSSGKLFSSLPSRRWMQISFILMELCSISLVLHLREARFYSLMILIQSILFYIYLDFNIFKKCKPYINISLAAFIFFISYSINYAFFCILFCCWIAVHGIFLVLDSDLNWKKPRGSDWKNFFIVISPVFLSFLIVLPFELLIFKTYKSTQMLKHSDSHYLITFGHVFNSFIKYEWLAIALFFKSVFISMFFFRKRMPEDIRFEFNRFFTVSIFLNILFVVSILAVCGINVRFYSRYIIPFQPILVLLVALEGYAVLKLLFYYSRVSAWIKGFVLVLAGILLMMNIQAQIPFIRQHITELRYPYKGPLDFIIPYIQKNYKNTNDLVIATNYETYSYMFYLKSHVLLGYIPLHLSQDLEYTPDILIDRKIVWERNPDHFNHYLNKARYMKINFPVIDYPVNCSPELYFCDRLVCHHFRTVYTNNLNMQTIIYKKIAN